MVKALDKDGLAIEKDENCSHQHTQHITITETPVSPHALFLLPVFTNVRQYPVIVWHLLS